MSWKDWLRRKPRKQAGREDSGAVPGAPGDEYGPLRELIFADESLEAVARFVLEQEAQGEEVRPTWRRLARVAAWVAQEHRGLAIEELYRILEDERDDARSCFQCWNFLRQLGEVPGPEVARRVLGLVIERSHAGRPELVAAYWDGTARWLDVKGGFRIFTDPDPSMVANIRRRLRVCRPLVEVTDASSGPRPPPPTGPRCRITVLTPAGLRMREGTWAALWDDDVTGPVLEMGGELTERLTDASPPKELWRPGVGPWPRRSGPEGEGGPSVH